MGNDARSVLTEALRLPDGDRADIAAQLIASLEQASTSSQDEIDELWAAEISRRAERVLAGASVAELWADVRARVERDLTAG